MGSHKCKEFRSDVTASGRNPSAGPRVMKTGGSGCRRVKDGWRHAVVRGCGGSEVSVVPPGMRGGGSLHAVAVVGRG